MSSGFSNLPKRVICGCLAQLVIMILGIAIVVQMSAVGNVSDQNLSTFSDLLRDWSTIPITEITVTDDDCLSGTESIFVREWRGTEPGCLVNKIGTFGSVISGSSQVIMT